MANRENNDRNDKNDDEANSKPVVAFEKPSRQPPNFITGEEESE